jgi:outer membrane immunogenic protein
MISEIDSGEYSLKVLSGDIENQRGRVMRLLVAGVGLLSAVAILQPANAAEIPARPKRERVVERPAPQQQAPSRTANWNGGQVGGSNGASSVNNSFVDPGSFICPVGSTFNSNCFETPFSFSGNKTSYTIGPFVGYRVQLGGWVVGLEGDWSWKNAETSLVQSSAAVIAVPSSVAFPSATNYVRTDQFSGSVKQKSDSSIRARLGWLVNPWNLLYVTGGVAFAEITGSFSYAGTLFQCPSGVSSPSVSSCATPSSSSSPSSFAVAGTTVSWNDTRVGSTVGAGWEAEVWTGVKARAEYRYTDFGNYTKTFGLTNTCSGSGGTACLSTPSGSVSIGLRESFHTFRVGLGIDLY